MNDPTQWPEGYRNWQGTFEELMAEATAILATLSPGLAPPTVSTVRYYQQNDLVGRGEKKGRSSLFSFQDLASLIATKQLAGNQIPLAVAKHVLGNAPAETLTMSYYASGSPKSASKKETPAEQLIGKLLTRSVSSSPAPPLGHLSLSGSISPTTARAFSVQSAPFSPSPLPPGGVIRYALAAGVVVELDVAHANREAQASALRAFADQLSPTPPGVIP